MADAIPLTTALDQWLAAKLSAALAEHKAEIAKLRSRIDALEMAGPRKLEHQENGAGSAAKRPSTESAEEHPGILEIIGRRTAPPEARASAYTIQELKELCSLHGLAKSGVKADLVRRLAENKVDPMELELVELFSAIDLRNACSEKGLATTGSKPDLARRLLQ